VLLFPLACASDGGDSPSGRIAFAIELAGNWRIATVRAPDPDGLTTFDTPVDSVAETIIWSPDGERIAWDEPGVALWVMNADGSEPRQIYPHLHTGPQGIAWSPDSRRLAVADLTELVVVNADGTGRRVIERCACWAPGWSPDGRLIAYSVTGAPDDPVSAYLENDDGTGRRELARGHLPTWSPDGERLAFVRDGLFVVDRDGNGERRLARAADSASWSPDGSHIAFTHREVAHVVESDGDSERRLGPGEGVSWSPDSRFVAVRRDFRPPSLEKPETAIWIYAIDGSTERRLWPLEGLCECGAPAWEPG
jgi:Tol biopolymer transport system component